MRQEIKLMLNHQTRKDNVHRDEIVSCTTFWHAVHVNLPVADLHSNSKILDIPSRSNFLHFHAVFGKFWKIGSSPHFGLGPPTPRKSWICRCIRTHITQLNLAQEVGYFKTENGKGQIRCQCKSVLPTLEKPSCTNKE